MAEEISSPLLSLIKGQGLIDDLQYEEVVGEIKRNGASATQILQDFGIMDIDAILEVMAHHLGAQVVSLAEKEIPEEVAKLITANTARMYRCVPVEVYDGTVKMAFEDPLDPARVDEVGFVVKQDVQGVVASP